MTLQKDCVEESPLSIEVFWYQKPGSVLDTLMKDSPSNPIVEEIWEVSLSHMFLSFAGEAPSPVLKGARQSSSL